MKMPPNKRFWADPNQRRSARWLRPAIAAMGVTGVPRSMTDLKSKKWIVAKGIMFLGIALTTAALIFVEMPSVKACRLVDIARVGILPLLLLLVLCPGALRGSAPCDTPGCSIC